MILTTLVQTRAEVRLVALLSLAASPLFAQEATQPELVQLDPLVVTAQQSSQPLVVVADAKAPAQPLPSHDGADFLKAIPGFAVIRKGGADGDPVLRGQAGSRVAILLDDQCIFGGCGNRMDPPTAYVFPAAYDRIVVTKGPQSVLFGPGASAATVRFERDPNRADPTGAFGTFTVASYARYEGALDARLGNSAVYARATGTWAQSDDYEDGDGVAVHSQYERKSANATVGWTPNADSFVELSAAKSAGEAAYADRMMDGALFDRDNLALRFRLGALPSFVTTLEGQVYYNYVDHVMDNYSLRPFVASGMMSGRSASNPDRTTVGGRLVADLAGGENASFKLGVDHQNNRHTGRGTSNELTDSYEVKRRVRDLSFDQQGLFGEATYNLGQARLIGGARVDHWEAKDARASVSAGMSSVANPTANTTRDDNLVSGFARAEHDLADNRGTLYLGLGYASRFPDFWELGKESTTSVSGFATLEPERTTQLDLGTRWKLGPLTLNASLFANRIDDFILIQSKFSKPAGMMGTRSATIARNIEASSLGGELGALWGVAPNWSLDQSLAYVRGRNETDDLPLAQLPPLESRTTLTFHTASWSVGALARVVTAKGRVAVNQGNIVGQDIGPAAGFAVFSFNASWRATKFLRVSAGVDNLFDRTYAEFISRAGSAVTGYEQTTRVNEPGRTLWLKTDFTF
ncbi:MAG: TonB-dependent copper receptor [Opitutaceae bacterium]